MEQNHTPKANNSKDKDKHFIAQMNKVFKAFKEHPKTMLMVSIETGILRANLCRYVAEWKKEERIFLVRKGTCKISKHFAGYYTTNRELYESIVKQNK